MFQNRILLRDIFIDDPAGEKYLVYNHNDRTWVWPVNKLKTAMDLWQPTTKQGKLNKQSFMLIKNNAKAIQKAGLIQEVYSINPEIYEYIKENVNITEDFYLAAYMGNPSSLQNNKVTLQIYTDEKIIGYAKLTKEPQVSRLFEHEIETFRFLDEKGFSEHSKTIAFGTVADFDIFIQDTNKAIGDKAKLEFNNKHIEFVDKLVKNINTTCKYEESEFYNSVQYLRNAIKTKYPRDEKMIIEHSLNIIENRLKGTEGLYSFAHGDFTPWNVYYTDKSLRVFDFEYSKYITIPYIDAFHYMTEMSLQGFKYDYDKTIYIYEKNRKLLETYIKDTDFTYLCYLISIIAFYDERTIEKFSIDAHHYRDWIGIISYLNSRLD